MAEKDNKTPRRKKPVRLTFNISWIYFILLLGIGWMFFNQGGANPQKEEWADVKKQWLAGDIKEVVFIRNEFEGRVTIRPDRLSKYESDFGGNVPEKSPHFIFLVSGSFNAEEMFDELNAQLPEDQQVKVVIENHESWFGILEWLIFPLLLILMWVFMFRGMNRNMGGGAGGPGGIFNVGKSTGKLAEKDSMKVTFKDVAGLYGAKDEVMEIVDFLKNFVVPAAEKYDIPVAIEPLRPEECNAINTVADGVEIAKRVDSPYIKVLADVAHMYVQNEPMESLLEYKGWVVHAHTSNPDPDGSLDCKRIYPKKGDSFNQADFIEPLKAIGVEHCSIEANVLDFESDIRDAYEVLGKLR